MACRLFSLLQVPIVLFWIGAIFLFFPIILIYVALSFAGITIGGVFSETKYSCRSCGRQYSGEGRCPYCGCTVDAV